MSAGASCKVSVLAPATSTRDVYIERPIFSVRHVWRCTRVRRVLGRRPLVDITGEIEHAKGARSARETSYGRRGPKTGLSEVGAGRIKAVAPGVFADIVTPRSPLPLIFGRKVESLAEMLC
jgi:hypothetical protein